MTQMNGSVDRQVVGWRTGVADEQRAWGGVVGACGLADATATSEMGTLAQEAILPCVKA